ncbi:MAG: DNA mismatch repair protein MutS [Clostridiaceae bacterium]|nr:DNA mismatch repair protein MutS [Clostridiaceae bacterium]
MDSVFQRLNNTLSSAGEQCLYYLLRKPLVKCALLEERNRIIEFFGNNEKQRMDVQLLLAKLGKIENVDITNYFLNDLEDSSYKGTRYILLALGFLLSPLLLLFDLSLGMLAVLGFFITNMTVFNKKRYEIESHLASFNYIVDLINCADKIAGLQIKEISTYCKSLRNSLKNLKGIVSRSFLVLYRSEDPILEYIKVVLLGELIAYESMFKLILKYKNNLLEIFNTVGLIDSLISIASYRKSLQYYSTPVLRNTNMLNKPCLNTEPGYPKAGYPGSISSAGYAGSHGLIGPTGSTGSTCPAGSPVPRPWLSFKDIYHPLLQDPVANSLSIDKHILVTGSNASGKSTFLKTIAINAIFAQTIHTCLARKYASYFFMIFTSMAIKDNLLSGESYYIVEIKSLKRIIDSINPTIPCLCIIDEVLRGTNTVERIAASSELLKFLSRSNCLIIAATHDLELTSILKNHYNNYHFQEYITDDDIVFDYKLYPGKAGTRNAIKLLKIMGYEAAIVESAEARAKYFMEKGRWE